MISSTTFFDSINKISRNDYSQSTNKMFIDSAFYMLRTASKKSRIKDSFEGFYYDPLKIKCCKLKSEKTQSEYELLYDTYKNEIVFQSHIRNWWNIRNINDSFWSELIEVNKNFNIQFSADGGPIYDKEKTPEFNANYKSIIFNLMRVYVTAMLEPEEQRDYIGFGQLEIVWSPEKSTDQIISELNIAFKFFYRFNYLLWKSEDIRKQNRINRQKRKKQQGTKK